MNSFQSIIQKVHENYLSIGLWRIFFGASCDGWPQASSADAAKVLWYVFLLLHANRGDLRVTDTLPSVCASLSETMVHCICTFKYVLSTMGVGKESISKFLIGNRFHVKIRILSPYSKRYLLKNLLIDSLLTPIVESTYLNRDMCKFESSQKDESRWQSTYSSKAYRNTSAFKCCNI